MERVATLEEFRRAPVGRFLAGPTWLHFCATAELFGVMLWGRPTEDHVDALVHSLKVELDGGVARHRSVVDASALRGVDLGAFSGLQRYVRSYHAGLRERVTRLSLVRPAGLEGAVVAGFYSVLEAPYPVAVFEDLTAALDWLGERDPARLAAELCGLRQHVSGVDPLIDRVRALCRGRLAGVRLDEAAGALGVSSRVLQRRLRAAGTTFQAELLRARLEEARRRMLGAEAPLTRIAHDLGFASLQHFSASFRREVGEPPSRWRERHRG